jgi:hypothetical protein
MTENKSIIERIAIYLKAKKIAPAKFERSIGAGNNYLNNVKSIGSDKLSKIAETYSDLNLEWLITGEGDMIRANRVGHTSGDRSFIKGDIIKVEGASSQLEIAQLKIAYLEERLKDKEELIGLLKKQGL